jgi:hypothetical protein
MEHVSCCTRLEGQNASTRHASAKVALIEVCREAAVSVDAHEPREYASVTCPACGSDVSDAQWKAHIAECPAFRASPEGIRHRSGPDVRYYVNGATVTVDFTVIGLGCPSKVSRPVAALVKEVCGKKIEKYGKACADRGEEFVVFAATSHGHLFAETERQIRRITGHVGATTAEALSRVSTAVIRGTAAALLNAERVAGIAPPTKEERQARETRRLQLLAEPASQLMALRATDLLSLHADVQRDLLTESSETLRLLFANICARSAPNLEIFQLAVRAFRDEEMESRCCIVTDEASAQDRLSRTLEDGWHFLCRQRAARAIHNVWAMEGRDRADLEDDWLTGSLAIVASEEKRTMEAVADAADRRDMLSDITRQWYAFERVNGRTGDPALLRQRLAELNALPTWKLRAAALKVRLRTEYEVQAQARRSEASALVGRITAVLPMPLTSNDVIELGNESCESLRDFLRTHATSGENPHTVATICSRYGVAANPPALPDPGPQPPRSPRRGTSASGSITSRITTRQTALSVLQPRQSIDDRAAAADRTPRTPVDPTRQPTPGTPRDAGTPRETTTLDFWRFSEVLTPRSAPPEPVATPQPAPVAPARGERHTRPRESTLEEWGLHELARSPAALPRDRPQRLTTATALPGSPRASTAPAPRGSVAARR